MTYATPVGTAHAAVATDGWARFAWTFQDNGDKTGFDQAIISFYNYSNSTVDTNSYYATVSTVPGQNYAYIDLTNLGYTGSGATGNVRLPAGQTYMWRVVIRNSRDTNQDSAQSANSQFSTLTGNYLPAINIGASDFYGGGTKTNLSTDVTVRFSWTPNSNRPSDTPAAIQVISTNQQMSDNPGTIAPTYTIFDGTPTASSGTGYNYIYTIPASNFVRGYSYGLTVRVKSSAGETYTPTQSISFKVPPNPGLTSADNTSFDNGIANTLSWTYTNTYFEAGPQASYVVSYRKVGDTAWTQYASANTAATSVTIPKFTFDDHYNYQFKIDVTSNLQGTASVIATWTSQFVYRTQNVALGPVTSFNAFTNKTFTWTYTPNNYQDPQKSWQMKIVNSTSGATEYDSGVVSGTATTNTVPSGTLRNAQDYTWSVSTINNRGLEQPDVPAHYDTIPPQDMGITWEDGTWYAIDSTQPAATPQYTGKYRTAPYALRLRSQGSVGTAGKSNEFRKDFSNLIVGTTYTWSLWAARTTADYASTFVMGVVGGSNPTNSISSYTTGTNFYQHTYTFTATNTAMSLYITVKSGNTSGSIADGVFDDMVFTQNEYQKYVPTTYKNPAVPVTASAAMHTQMPPNASVVTHRTDFIASNPQTFQWTFSDRDDGDSQSAYQVQIQSQDGSQVFVDTGKVFGSTSAYTLPANTLAGGMPYRWHVYTWDQQDQQSPPSAWDNFSTAAPVNVVITAPTDGASLDTNYVDVAWTFSTVGGATQQSYRVKVINQNNQVVTVDSGSVTSSATTYRATGIASNVPYRIEVVATSSAGVSSNTAVVTFTSFYNNPMKPIAVVVPTAAYISVNATNPPISGSRPATTYNEVWRARGTSNSYQKLTTLALGQTYKDYYTAAGTTYSYFIRAYAANGNYLDSTPVDGSTKNQQGIVMFRPDNPDLFTRQFPYGNIGRTESISVNATSRTYVTGVRPEFTFSGNGNKQVSLSVTVPYGSTYDADLAALKSIVRNRQVVVYKDNRGRFLTGVITTINIKDEKFGSTVSGDFNQTSYTELRI